MEKLDCYSLKSKMIVVQLGSLLQPRWSQIVKERAENRGAIWCLGLWQWWKDLVVHVISSWARKRREGALRVGFSYLSLFIKWQPWLTELISGLHTLSSNKTWMNLESCSLQIFGFMCYIKLNFVDAMTNFIQLNHVFFFFFFVLKS